MAFADNKLAPPSKSQLAFITTNSAENGSSFNSWPIGGLQIMARMNLKLVTPTIDFQTVAASRRKPNAHYRTREHLTEAEVERLMAAARQNRWGHRDATMILVAYRHGLRVSELVDLRWDQIDFAAAALHVRRLKRGTPATHPILGDELRALRRLRREQIPNRRSCSRPSAARRSPRRALPAWSSAWVRWPSLVSQGTPAHA